MAATRARTEVAAASTPQNVKHVTPTREVATADAAATVNDQTPARRTTTRTRKLPSRLLPSPSPPPSRPTSYYNAAKHSKGGKDVSEPSAVSPAATPSNTSAAASKLRKTAKMDADSTSSDLDAANDKDDAEDLGPGKRKRRPSSMQKPPSTLTTVETPSVSASSASKSKKKGRSLSPEASAQKSQSPSVAVSQARLKGRLSKGKSEAATPLSKKGETAAVAESLHVNGDDSEAELDYSFSSSASKRVRIGDADDSMDLSPPPLLPRDGSARIRMPTHFTQPTFIRGGRVSVSPEASAKRPVKFGIRDFNRPALASDETDADRFRIGSVMRANKTSAQRSDIMSSSPVSAGINRFDNDSGAPLTYVPFRSGVRSAAGFRNMHITPFANQAVDEDDEEDEDDDDENDFHQAMLDADFDFLDSQKSETAAKPLWPAARRGTTEDIEMDDTPATTPRSPQSGCDLPSPDSPRCKAEEEPTQSIADDKVSLFLAGRDSVFVHALPTTQVGADKPHQHAGSLTLSLPYSPAVAASSPQLRALDLDAEAVAAAKRGAKDANTNTQMGTPVLQRRKHVGMPAGPHGLAPLKLSAELMERSASNSASYMQLSPMIEIDSPLLSPGLSLSLHGKGGDLPSPFLMGVGALADLEQPAPLDLPPADGSTTPKASSPEVFVPEAPKSEPAQPTSVEAKDEVSKPAAVAIQPESKVVEASKEVPKETPKVEKPSARRPALPPPRQIRFTTFTTPTVESGDSRPQQTEVSKTSATAVPPQQQQTTQHQSSAGGTTTSPKSDSTPDLIHSSSSSPDSASDSPSPMSQADTATSGDAEVETILFGPPEKLDLHELDHAWNGSKAAAQRRAQVTQIRQVDVDAQ